MRLLLVKAASLDDVLVYLRLLPPGRFGLNATTSPRLLGPETPTSYLIADLSEQTQRLSSRLYGGKYNLLLCSNCVPCKSCPFPYYVSCVAG